MICYLYMLILSVAYSEIVILSYLVTGPDLLKPEPCSGKVWGPPRAPAGIFAGGTEVEVPLQWCPVRSPGGGRS